MRAPQVRSDTRDVGIAERPAEGRHDDTCHAFIGVDAAQDDLDQIARIEKVHRAVEREIRACRERRAGRVVVTGGARGSVEPRVGIELIALLMRSASQGSPRRRRRAAGPPSDALGPRILTRRIRRS